MSISKAFMRDTGKWLAGDHGGDIVDTTEGSEAEESTDFVTRPDDAESVTVFIYGDVAIAAAQQLTIIANIQDAGVGGATPADLSADLSTQIGPGTPLQVFDGDVSTAGQFMVRITARLHGAREEIRVQYTLAYTGGTNEVTQVVVFMVFGGTETTPAPQTTANH